MSLWLIFFFSDYINWYVVFFPPKKKGNKQATNKLASTQG